jgi:signal transduction histidine kinase
VSKHSYLEAGFKNSPNAIIAVDEHCQVFDINPAAVTIFGWSYKDAVGQHCTQLLKCRNLNGTALCGTSGCPLTRVIEQKQAIAQEELIMGLVTDHPHEFTTSVIPVEHQYSAGVMFVARDMSAIKVANRVRANFVSMVSHELRTPLNSVHGFIDLLLQGHMGELAEEQHKYLGYAQEGVQQLISIVEDILLLTRSDSGQFELKQQEVDFHELAKLVVTSLQPQALKAEVTLNQDISEPSTVLYADPQRMKQVLNNLVTNAIKFTPPDGSVTINACPYNERFAMISVSDTGYGIPVEDRQHVFERFYQSNHALQSKMGGYGLGLSIVRLIVEQHGGEIGFDSVLDKGTTFKFTVPLFT